MTASSKTWAIRVSWVLQILAAIILLQTLFFKFTAAEESIYIFSKLGMEPWGRIGTGVVELIASGMMLIPGLAVPGAVIALCVMSGAIASHLGPLGIVVQDDGGWLFTLAVTVFVCCVGILVLRRDEVRRWIARLRGKAGGAS